MKNLGKFRSIWAAATALLACFCVINDVLASEPVRPGQKVTMWVTADGYPDPDITWTRDGVPVNHGDNNGNYEISGPKGGTLVIKVFSPLEAGDYVAKATNIVGFAVSQPESLTVAPNGVPIEKARIEIRFFTYDYRRESQTKTASSSGPDSGRVRGDSPLEFRYKFTRSS